MLPIILLIVFVLIVVWFIFARAVKNIDFDWDEEIFMNELDKRKEINKNN